MRSASASTVSSLFGSLGLHAGVVLVLVVAARQPPEAAKNPPPPSGWQGTPIEVDALASPQDTPNLANLEHSEGAEEAAESASNPPVPAPQPPQPPQPKATPEPDPAPERRPAPRARAAPPSAVASKAAQTARSKAARVLDGQHEATTSAATGAFGSEGLPPGARSLPSAFTRAIPPATGADPIWQSLPTGTQRPFTLAVEVNAEGHIGEARILSSRDGSDIPVQFEHFRQRVLALLGGGLFALQNNGTAGRDLFRITITLSDRAVRDESGPAELVERGFDPPRGSSPGRAYFTLASGRHFEAKVEVLGAPSRAPRP